MKSIALQVSSIFPRILAHAMLGSTTVHVELDFHASLALHVTRMQHPWAHALATLIQLPAPAIRAFMATVLHLNVAVGSALLECMRVKAYAKHVPETAFPLMAFSVAVMQDTLVLAMLPARHANQASTKESLETIPVLNVLRT